ncbi:MAG: hypothetical protein AAFQ78_00500 [Bacteroidota bacterium]
MMRRDELLYSLLAAISDNVEDQLALLLEESKAHGPALFQRGLVFAAMEGSLEAIEIFLELGADVNGFTELSAWRLDSEGPYRGHYKQCALVAALSRARVGAVASLLAHGADVYAGGVEY